MSSSRAAPVSAITDQAERAVANARFSSYGRRLLGPRLPLPVDLETMGPEVAFAAFGAIRALHRVLETQGSVPPGTFLIVGANVAVFARVAACAPARPHTRAPTRWRRKRVAVSLP